MAIWGIDLGTTYSCIAYVDETSYPAVIRNEIGEDTTPSVVFFESPDSVVIGRHAKESAVLFPNQIAELVKREMGQDVHYSFFGRDYTPESISALILRVLARAAEVSTGEAVHDVVITVPVYFGSLEREATRKAGEIAGLNVLDVLAEPVAAALGYQALSDSSEVRHIFVYDLGGGTFDTTVIRVHGLDIQIVCTDGDHHLGGADWDLKIAEFLLDGFVGQHPDLDPGGDEQFMQDLVTAAEQLKKSLSSAMTRRYYPSFAGAVAQLDLTRGQLERMTSELLERTMEITARTIADAKQRNVSRFDDVLLVGGMSSMPVIAQTLKDRFGLRARRRDPHLAVARGAAISALGPARRVSLLPQDWSWNPEKYRLAVVEPARRAGNVPPADLYVRYGIYAPMSNQEAFAERIAQVVAYWQTLRSTRIYARLAEALLASHAELERTGGLTLRRFVELRADRRHEQDEQLARLATSAGQPKVFLCHSSSDKPRVRALRRQLLDDGCLPWFDEEDILPGQDWDREIRLAIRASDIVLVCLSGESINKVGYLQKEIRNVLDAADEQPEGTIFVIPARLEPCEVPERLRRWQWVNLFETNGYSRLLLAVRSRKS